MSPLMIRSMTGFARASGNGKKAGFTVEIRSLNHRYFEFSLKSSPSLYGLEDRIREFCQGRVRRGKVTVNITEDGAYELDQVALDEKVLRFYLSALAKVQRRFRLKGSLEVRDLFSLPRIFSVEKKSQAPEKMWRSLKPTLIQALGNLQQFRMREGKALAKDLLARISNIEKTLSRIEKRTKEFPREAFEKLRERLRNLLEEKMAGDEKVWQAAAFIAEKADVTEETVRLGSHLQLFREKTKLGGEVGKELDFVSQEMNREVNTIGSKAQDFGISREVVSIKAELEKIREQIQNIE